MVSNLSFFDITMSFTKKSKRIIFIGVFSLVLLFSGSYIMGHIGGYEAKQLIQSTLDGFQTLCNTIVLASATILALLLTVLGISSSADSRLKRGHYLKILQLAKLDTAVFTVALLAMVIFNIPITESDKIPEDWYSTLYYITVGIMCLISSALIVVVYMLYQTVSGIVKIVGLNMSDHPMVENDEEGKE